MRERLLYLLLMLGLVACGGEDKEKTGTAGSGGGGTSRTAGLAPAPTQDVGGEAAALVPADSHAVVCIRSLDAAVAMMNGFAEAIGEPLPMDPRMGLAMATGVDPAQVDGGKHVLAAFKMSREAPEPFVTFVLPVKDPEQAGGALPNKVTSGGYLGMSSLAEYAAGDGSALLDGMPDGDIVLRVDLAALTKLYDPEIQGMLGMGQGFLTGAVGREMPGVDAADMVGKVFGWARDVMGSAERLDIVGGAKGGVVDVDLAYTAKEGSALAKSGRGTALDSLAKYAPTDFPLTLLFKFDMSTYMEWSRGFMNFAMETMPAESRESYRELMTKAEELMKDFGEDWLFSANVGKEGISFVMAGSAKDAAGYIAKYLELVKDPGLAGVGMSFKAEEERVVAGAKVQRVRITVDGEKFAAASGMSAGEIDMFVALLFGTGGINLDMAAVGDRIVMVVGREDSLTAQVLGSSEPSPALRAARAEARGDLGFLVHVELRSLMQGIAALAGKVGEKVPEIPDGPPAPLTFYGSREDRIYRFGLHVDAEQMKSVVELLD